MTVLYRKYRPQLFEEVVGQDHIERTIKNAILQGKVSHAYLFCGPRGTGKTTTARLLAKALLCESGPTPEPDGTCPHCEEIANGTHPDVYELDAASRTGVENVREEIIGRVQFAPTLGRSKVYIIDEVHMLSTAAFNALLKTLEEPPSHVIFILCTTDPHKVPETIHSRCQRFDFHRIATEVIVSRLGAICVAEEVEFDGDALDLIAHRAEGGMRDALTSLEQLITFGEGKVTLDSAEYLLGSLDMNDMAEIVTAIGRRDVGACFTWAANYIETGADLAQFVRDLAQHMRDMYVMELSENDTVLEVSEVVRRQLTQEIQYFDSDRLVRMLSILGDLSGEMRTSLNPRLSFEIALTRMVRPSSDLTLESLAERLDLLEKKISQGDFSAAPSIQRESAPQEQITPAQKELQVTSAEKAFVPENSSSEAAEEAMGVRETSSIVSPKTQAKEPEEQMPAAPQEQAATPAKSVEPVEAGKLENPAAFQRIWQGALQTIQKNKAAYGVLLINARASFDEPNQQVVIEFPAENTFAFAAVQKPEISAVLAEALHQAAGIAVAFEVTQANAASEPAPTPTPTPASESAPQAQPVPSPKAQPSQPVDPRPEAKATEEKPANKPMEKNDPQALLTEVFGDGTVFEVIEEKE